MSEGLQARERAWVVKVLFARAIRQHPREAPKLLLSGIVKHRPRLVV